MPSRFSFDGALSYAFRAPYFRTFPWIFALAYALAFTAFLILIALLAQGDLRDVVRAIEALENASVGQDDPEAVFAVIREAMTPLLPWAVNAIAGCWVIWAIFEAASQRRYIRSEKFSVQFGGDELRIMGVGLAWALMQLVFFIVPAVLFFGAIGNAISLAADNASEAEIASQVVGPMFGAIGLWLILFIIYVFFATRLAPCFALTIKERRFRFLDAWNVSRGRFWPILGAFVILSIGGGMAVGLVDQIMQFFLGFAIGPVFEDIDTGEDFLRAVGSFGLIVPFALYMVVRFFMSGLLMHFAAAPAAFAARHDPRGGIGDEERMDVFN